MFNLINDKKFHLSKKLLCQILEDPNSPPFYKVMNEHVLHMFNEIGYQLTLTKITEFKKSSLLCIWNFLFGIQEIKPPVYPMKRQKMNFLSIISQKQLKMMQSSVLTLQGNCFFENWSVQAY